MTAGARRATARSTVSPLQSAIGSWQHVMSISTHHQLNPGQRSTAEPALGRISAVLLLLSDSADCWLLSRSLSSPLNTGQHPSAQLVAMASSKALMFAAIVAASLALLAHGASAGGRSACVASRQQQRVTLFGDSSRVTNPCVQSPCVLPATRTLACLCMPFRENRCLPSVELVATMLDV